MPCPSLGTIPYFVHKLIIKQDPRDREAAPFFTVFVGPIPIPEHMWSSHQCCRRYILSRCWVIDSGIARDLTPGWHTVSFYEKPGTRRSTFAEILQALFSLSRLQALQADVAPAMHSLEMYFANRFISMNHGGLEILIHGGYSKNAAAIGN